MRALRMASLPMSAEVDENRVIEAILGGDVDAYSHFVRRYQRKVYGVALRLLRDVGEAECVAQEAFLKAYQALPGFRGGATFETWVTRIAVNACRDRLKRKRLVLYFHQTAPREDEDEGPRDLAISEDPTPDRLLLAREIRARVLAALAHLSPRQRTVFSLKHFEERSIPEIAEILGLDSGTVKSHLFRASQKLRRRLDDLRRTR